MRSEATLSIVLCCGCAIDISAEGEEPSKPSVSVPAIQKCEWTIAGVEKLEGRIDTLTLPDGATLLTAAAATVSGKTTSAGIVVTRNGNCPRAEEILNARPIIDMTPLSVELQATPLAGVTTDAAYVYFSGVLSDGTPDGGIGIARYEPSTRSFVAQSWLWTSDRPGYGSGAVINGSRVYVFGGQSARFLSADVYLARVDVTRIEQAAAYEYWEGGGNWGTDADLAAPLVEGGASPSIAWDAAHARWLMAYATPLAREITVRSGLDVDGPWSAPMPLAKCDLPATDDQAFCNDIVLHPLLSESSHIVVSQSVQTFERPPNARGSDYDTRVLYSSWPDALP